MSSESIQKFSISQFLILFVVHAAAVYGVISYFSWSNFAIWLVLHQFFGIIGASIGLHRLFSHKSFKAHPVLEKIIATIATLCFQGGPIFWASSHRAHHRLAEKQGDPYDANKGFIWSHIGWLLYKNPNGFSYLKSLREVSDLRKNKFLNWLEVNSTILNVSALAILLLITVYFNRVDLFFWLGPIRLVSVWHATWLINSYAHRATFFKKRTAMTYRNSILMCFLIGGDGYHDYHHKFPAIPKHAPGLLHLDFGYYVLKLLSLIGLVTLRPDNYSRPEAGDYLKVI